MSSSFRSLFLRHLAQTSLFPDGFEVSRAAGIYLYDQEDQPFLDCISGITVSSFGHHHPAITNAIRQQLDRYLHTMVYGEHIQQPQVKLVQKLAQLLPAQLDCTFLTNSGTEAVEGALKLARKFTSRYEIIACRNAYHGSTAGSESLRSDISHTASSRPLVPGVRHIDFNAITDLSQINASTAAVIIEPIQGEAGVILPQADYLKSLRTQCDQTGTLLIFDEIQTGMGRTGSLFAFEQENVTPDILLLAKAFGGGLPLGAFISSSAIMSVLADDPMLGYLSTFGGHPLSCAASLAAIDLLLQPDFIKNITATGNYIRQKLSDHPIVKEVRGRGLMLAVELNNAALLNAVVQSCRHHGLLTDWFLFNDRSIRLYPPLIITEKEAMEMCDKLLLAFDAVDQNQT